VVSMVSAVSFRSFCFDVSPFSTCHSDLLPDAFSGCSDVGGLLSNRLLLDFP
jgi:hypothetical protein